MKKTVLITACLALMPVAAHAQYVSGTSSGVIAIPAEDPADSLFRLGKAALNDNDYRRAANLFSQVAEKYPNFANAADALYWRAWALYHLGLDRHAKSDLDDALASIDKLQTRYPQATAATTDAASLRTQIRGAQANLGDARAATDITKEAKGLTQAGSCAGPKGDEEMRLAALEGLLNMNAADAVPILKDVLKQRDPCRIELRKKAIWLISQKRQADVVSTLLDVARNDPSVDVRKEALFWMSQTHSEAAITALDSVLFSARDDDVRKQAIFALSQQQSSDRARQAIRRAAESDKMSEDIRSEAIFWLGQSNMADLDYFKTLYQKTPNVELRKKIVFAVSQTRLPGASTWLIDIARDKSADIDVRKDAIFYAAQGKAVDFAQLSSLYDQSRGDNELQDQILFVISQRREAAAVDKLMDIAKNDPSIERKKSALFWLGQKNDPRIKQFIRDIVTKPD
ncbi:MAG: HEAT repeat domain-containing protein [Gemmatimonadaceae bacterium]